MSRKHAICAKTNTTSCNILQTFNLRSFFVFGKYNYILVKKATYW